MKKFLLALTGAVLLIFLVVNTAEAQRGRGMPGPGRGIGGRGTDSSGRGMVGRGRGDSGGRGMVGRGRGDSGGRGMVGRGRGDSGSRGMVGRGRGRGRGMIIDVCLQYPMQRRHECAARYRRQQHIVMMQCRQAARPMLCVRRRFPNVI